MKKIVTLGGSGFIGSNLIEMLLEEGYTIVNIDQSINIKCPINDNYTIYKHNLCNDFSDKDKLIQDLKECDCIINLAAESHVDHSIENYSPFIDSNIRAIYQFFESCKQNDIDLSLKQIIHFSTDEVYGDGTKSNHYDEHTPLNPHNPYAASKASGDMHFSYFQKELNFTGIILRPANCFGKYQDTKFIPTIFKKLSAGQKIPIYGQGTEIRNWLDVKDLCNLILILIGHHQKSPELQIYNIANRDVYYSNHDFVEMILRVMVTSGYYNQDDIADCIEFVKNRHMHDKMYPIVGKKVEEIYNWKPNINTCMKFETISVPRLIKHYFKG
jgi:dTDP-glucose 4,6-dehydratase